MRHVLVVICLLGIGGLGYANDKWQATRIVPVASPVAVDLTKLSCAELGLPPGTTIEPRHCLVNSSVVTQLYQYDQSGHINYLLCGYADSKSTIYKTEDWVSYCCVTYEGVKVRIGVGVRCQAALQSRERKLDLGGIFNLTFGLATKKVVGYSEVHVLGLSGPIISALSPQGGTITPDSIRATEKATAVIMSKLYDEETRMTPVILGQEVPVAQDSPTAFQALVRYPSEFRGLQERLQ